MKADNTNNQTPTLEDVARTAKVSPATVSRYLNNPTIVSERSKRKIDEAIQTLNYVPHAAARTLASKRSRMIGAIVPSLDSSLFGRILEVFQAAISNVGYTLVVASHNYDVTKEREQINQMVSHGVDALLLVGASRDESIYQLLNSKEIPYVLTCITSTQMPHPCVGFNNIQAASKVTNYLLDMGHQHFGFISGHLQDNDRAQQRLLGIKDSLAARGLNLANDNVIETGFGVEQGREAFRTLMASPIKPTAIICGSEPFAYGAIFESQTLGISIPEQVSITGFDDMWLASNITPRLTTVKTPQQQMGEHAAKFLISTLNNESVSLPGPLDFELVVRDSCSPPPKGD